MHTIKHKPYRIREKDKKRFKTRNIFLNSPFSKTPMKAFLIKKTRQSLLLLFLVLFLIPGVKAQFISASLGIHGLTCSLCSYGVEREIEKLDFVESVDMDLNQNIATIRFQKGKAVVIKDLVESVYKAGFSVGYTQALFSFDQLRIDNEAFFTYEGAEYFILENKSESLKGEHIIRFIDKKYVVPKEFNVWKEKIKLNNKQKSSSKNTVTYQIIIL